MSWYVYIVKCSDGSLYTGITTDVYKRIKTHNSGKGSKYCRSRLPVELQTVFNAKDRSDASKMEYAIKKLSRESKNNLINQF